MQLLRTVVTYVLKNYQRCNLTYVLILLKEFIPELYSRFNEYRAILVDDQFDILLVCNIIHLGIVDTFVTRNRFCPLSKTPQPPRFLTDNIKLDEIRIKI